MKYSAHIKVVKLNCQQLEARRRLRKYVMQIIIYLLSFRLSENLFYSPSYNGEMV